MAPGVPSEVLPTAEFSFPGNWGHVRETIEFGDLGDGHLPVPHWGAERGRGGHTPGLDPSDGDRVTQEHLGSSLKSEENVTFLLDLSPPPVSLRLLFPRAQQTHSVLFSLSETQARGSGWV